MALDFASLGVDLQPARNRKEESTRPGSLQRGAYFGQAIGRSPRGVRPKPSVRVAQSARGLISVPDGPFESLESASKTLVFGKRLLEISGYSYQ
jgi:hypothetical protein